MVGKVENKNRKILVVDDDPDSLKIITAVLGADGYNVDQASSGDEAIDKIHRSTPHLVLLDINMPKLNGLDTLKLLRLREQYVSVVFVTARSETEDVISGLDAGADDYIRKPFDMTELLARIRTQLRIKDLNDQLRSVNRRLQELVDTDDLTGLFNMRSLYQKLDNELERARRYDRLIGVVMMDMDNFKLVNDNHDHLFGSFVLGETGKIIRANIRKVDFAARYGGDEFLIVLTETSFSGISRFSERIRQTIHDYDFRNGPDEIRLTASLGFAIITPGDTNIDARSLVRTADRALYQAKQSGKNCVRFVDLNEQEIGADNKVKPLRKTKKSS